MAQIDPIVSRLDKRYRTLQSQRSNWEKHWQELADYMLPRKADIVKKRTQGDKRTDLIYDGTAIHAVELLASSLHGMLTSRNRNSPAPHARTRISSAKTSFESPTS